MENIRDLPPRCVRQTYLITYSRADRNLCNTRQMFGNLVLDAFEFNQGRVRPKHWAVCQEAHEGVGFHYHMSLCLTFFIRMDDEYVFIITISFIVSLTQNRTVNHDIPRLTDDVPIT